MRYNDITEQCKSCQNLKVWAPDMGGNHGVTCKKGLPYKKMMIAKNVECDGYEAEERRDVHTE